VSEYGEYDRSAQYLHLLSMAAWEQLRPRLGAVLSSVDSSAGTMVEFGPGSGLGTEILLDTVADAPVLAAEPSAALRGILLARLAGSADAARLTVYPSGAADAPLPDRIAAVVGLHMVGHLRPDVRRALWSKLADRLAPGAPVVFNVQPPDTAIDVPEFPPIRVHVGRLTYEGTGSAIPTGPDSLRWHMRYSTVDGNRVVDQATADYDWWIVPAPVLADELTAAGLSAMIDDDLIIAKR
jgi:hypothetical protein